MGETPCLGHLNDFEHLPLDLDPLENEFDLGYKFAFRESDSYKEIPETGVKAWAEPYLALCVSAKRLSAALELPPTLHYGLTRSKFANRALQPQEADRQRLLELATSNLKNDLRMLSEGETPGSLKEPRML
jgi:hypothetical protein